MKKVFKGVISFKVSEKHPDIQHVKNPNEVLTFEDTYTLDSDNYYNEDEMINFIKHDLSLVAGGGYSKEHIYNATFEIKQVG